MPGPPPPPPPAPAPTFSLPKGGGGPDDRSALLKSIQKGTKLKKTVTVDKSAPMIPGKVSNIGNNNSAPASGNGIKNNSTHSSSNGMALGGLFAGGMPKLKPTGRPGASTLNFSNTNLNNNEIEKSPNAKVAPSKNFGSVQDQLKRQLHNPSDTRTRGPPPPAPIRQTPPETPKSPKPFIVQENGLHLSQTSLHPNVSTLHRKSKSNANLSSLDCTDNVNSSGFPLSKPVINHGKPNLAPKPPVNGKPAPPTKLIMKPNKPISRAQSMRSPRSPSPQSPTPNNDAGIKFGTVRNMSSIIGQSLMTNTQGTQNPRPRPPLTNRPTVPPPSVPPPAAPSKVQVVKPPNHAPPPPPSVVPQPPNHAPPPPPPHKTYSQPSRPPPAVPGSTNQTTNPPPPPPRHSSMRDANQQATRRIAAAVDLEDKFKALFQTPEKFPKPPPYRNVLKLYSNRQVTNKQQAPLPPQLQSANRAWNSTSTC